MCSVVRESNPATCDAAYASLGAEVLSEVISVERIVWSKTITSTQATRTIMYPVTELHFLRDCVTDPKLRNSEER